MQSRTAVLFAGLVLALPACADESPTRVTPETSPVSLFPHTGGGGPDQPGGSTRVCSMKAVTGEVRCFRDLAAYLADRTGGRITKVKDPSNITEAEIDAIDVAAAEARRSTGARITSSVTTAILYDLPYRNYSADYIFMDAPSGCDTNKSTAEWAWSALTASFDNRTSSFQGYNNCAVKLWTAQTYAGIAWGPASYTDSFGGHAIDNNASSVKVY